MELKLRPEKIETLEYLISRVFEKDQTGKPKFCFLLGAGCSAYSGIPLGWGVIERCRTIVFLNHHPHGSKVKNMNYPSWRDFYISAEKFREDRRDEFDKFVTETEIKFKKNLTEKEIRDILPDELENDPDFDFEKYSEKVFNDRLYGFWLDKYDEDPRERQMFIEHIIEDVEPAGDYILFTSLVEGQVIHNVFTTNFDDLLNEALINYFNNRARVYAHNEMARYISPISKRPNIIKLHGDYLYENIKNTNLETGDLEANMKTKFSEMLNQMNLVVVGYGGADHSVMSVLELVKKDTKYCLIWCGSDPEKLNWRVVHLLNSTKNSFFVPVSDFQTLVFKLWTNADLKLPDLEEGLKVKKSRLEEFLMKYKDQVKDKDEVTQNEMEILIDRTEALKWFNKGYAEKDYSKQVEFYSKAIKFNPKDHLAYYNRAFSYGELKNYNLAIEDLNNCLKIDPTYSNAYINRGLAYNNLNQYDKAIDDYTKAIEYEPNSALAYGNRSLVYYDLKKYDKVIDDCNKAIELDPSYVNAYINRGLAFSNLKQFDKALLDYNKALELNPNQALAYNNRGLLYYDATEYEKAIEDYNKSIELDPKYTNAYINRGLAYYYTRQYEKAIDDYNTAIQLNADYAIAYINRGLAYYDLLKNDLAIEDYNKAIELDPGDALSFGNRGMVYHDRMEYDKAIEDYNKAITLNPGYTNAYINRGLARYNLQQFEKAVADYDRALELNPGYYLAYQNRGLAKYSLLLYEEAAKDFDKAIELNKDNTGAYIDRGNNFFGLKQYEEAIEDYSTALKLDPGNSLAFANRAMAFFDIKKYTESIRDLEKSIELNPRYLLAYQTLSEAYILTGQFAKAEKSTDASLQIASSIHDKVLITYLKIITYAMTDNEIQNLIMNFNEMLNDDFLISWNLNQLEDWILKTEMPEEKRKNLQELTEKLKEKIVKLT